MTSQERNEFDIRDIDHLDASIQDMDASIQDMDTQKLAHQMMESNNYNNFNELNDNESSHPHFQRSQDQVDLINANVQKLLRNRNKPHSLQKLGDSLKLKRLNEEG